MGNIPQLNKQSSRLHYETIPHLLPPPLLSTPLTFLCPIGLWSGGRGFPLPGQDLDRMTLPLPLGGKSKLNQALLYFPFRQALSTLRVRSTTRTTSSPRSWGCWSTSHPVSGRLLTVSERSPTWRTLRWNTRRSGRSTTSRDSLR